MELTQLGIRSDKIKQFNKKGITTMEELKDFLPRKYVDCTTETDFIADNKTMCCITAKCDKVVTVDCRIPMFKAECEYKGKNIRAVWLNQLHLYPMYCNYEKHEVYICGTFQYNAQYHYYETLNPFLFTDWVNESKRIYSIHSNITGMSDDFLRKQIVAAFKQTTPYEEFYSDAIRKEYGLLPKNDAMKKLQFPKTMEDIDAGQKRLAFDDMLYFACKMEHENRSLSKGSQYGIHTMAAYYKVLDSLPYTLTEDQQKALDGMIGLIKDGKRLNCLLQGDVSCGKSIVSFLLAILMADNGYQTAIMAPTQVLARQHYEEVKELAAPFGIETVFYSGTSLKAKEKREALAGIASGRYKIVVGTHSLISPVVEYKELAMAIVDEEHKFGVLQRQALVDKASTGVHSITMSATPIPRSLAQVIYGDNTELFSIHSMPNNRKRVRCANIPYNKKKSIFSFLIKELNAGHQAYVVCPAIDRNEKRKGLRTVNEVRDEYQKELDACGKGHKVAIITGKMSKTEIERIIGEFKENRIQVLVSTIIIEVGVNVPNATAIIIENANNFGLSNLHQLRGRVGRGSYQSYCVLVSDFPENVRLQTMMSTNDGFEIANADFKERGPGGFIGTKQSGNDKYISLILSSEDNIEWYKKIKETAGKMVDRGEDLLLCSMFDTEELEEE